MKNNHYNKISKSYNDKKWVTSKKLIQTAKELLEYQSNCGKVLDVGIGTGIFPFLLNIDKEQLFGIDLSNKMLSLAKQYFDHLVLASGESIPFKNQNFILVIERNVLKHVERPDDFLKEISRIIIPGGKILIIESVALNKEHSRFLSGLLSITEPNQKVYTLRELQSLVYNNINTDLITKRFVRIRQYVFSDYLCSQALEKSQFHESKEYILKSSDVIQKLQNMEWNKEKNDILYDSLWAFLSIKAN